MKVKRSKTFSIYNEIWLELINSVWNTIQHTNVLLMIFLSFALDCSLKWNNFSEITRWLGFFIPCTVSIWWMTKLPELAAGTCLQMQHNTTTVTSHHPFFDTNSLHQAPNISRLTVTDFNCGNKRMFNVLPRIFFPIQVVWIWSINILVLYLLLYCLPSRDKIPTKVSVLSRYLFLIISCWVLSIEERQDCDRRNSFQKEGQRGYLQAETIITSQSHERAVCDTYQRQLGQQSCCQLWQSWLSPPTQHH